MLLTVKVLQPDGPIICDKCGSKHQNRQSFKDHHLLKHSLKFLFCDLCPESFRKKFLIARHIKKVHLKTTFDCTTCTYKGTSALNLKNHMFRHGTKIECKICHKMVTNLREHKKLHIKVKCSICGKECSRATLSFHKKSHRNHK